MSPCLIIKSPDFNDIVCIASAKLFLSYGIISFKIKTLLKKSSYFSRLALALALTILLNVALSNANRTQFSFAIIDACRGTAYNKANSPNASPG